MTGTASGWSQEKGSNRNPRGMAFIRGDTVGRGNEKEPGEDGRGFRAWRTGGKSEVDLGGNILSMGCTVEAILGEGGRGCLGRLHTRSIYPSIHGRLPQSGNGEQRSPSVNYWRMKGSQQWTPKSCWGRENNAAFS